MTELAKEDIPARIDHVLETHHALLHRELPRIASAELSPDFQTLWDDFSAFMASHLMKEEHILFPSAKGMAAGEDVQMTGLQGPIAQMGTEHEQVEDYCEQIRAAAEDGGAGAEREAVLAVLDDLAVHAGLEDDELFPAILKLADEAGDAQALREAEARASMASKIRDMEEARPARQGKRARLKKALGGLFGR